MPALSRFVVRVLDLVEAESLAAQRGVYRLAGAIVASALAGVLVLAGIAVLAGAAVVALEPVFGLSGALFATAAFFLLTGGLTIWLVHRRMTAD